MESKNPDSRNELRRATDDFEAFLFHRFVDFEKICDNLPDAIYIADKEGTTVYVNDMYQQLSGILKEEAIGENIHQINREKKLYTNGILPTILKQERRSEKIGVMNRTNTTVYITGFPIFDDNHELKYAVAHDRNIQQLEIVKDQLLHLKEVQAKTENEVQYLRTQQIKQVDLIFKSPQMYQASSRFNKPFLKINCAAIPETLMESELFGYVPGAFTGASKNGKTGIFEMANGGTLMLDEIGEMSMPMQTKLLRVLQNHEVTKVGSSKAIPIDVRIIAATNRNLLECIKEKTFREDLYYRLNVVPISLAPLRERKEDIDVLVHHFLDVFNKKYNKQVEIYSDALHLMTAYNWPGNIRELENVIERLVVINRSNVIDKKTVSMVVGIPDNDGYMSTEKTYNLKKATTNLECQIIKSALTEFRTKRKAAIALGIDHSTLVKKCQRYGI